jgi:hypothetical protein
MSDFDFSGDDSRPSRRGHSGCGLFAIIFFSTLLSQLAFVLILTAFWSLIVAAAVHQAIETQKKIGNELKPRGLKD